MEDIEIVAIIIGTVFALIIIAIYSYQYTPPAKRRAQKEKEEKERQQSERAQKELEEIDRKRLKIDQLKTKFGNDIVSKALNDEFIIGTNQEFILEFLGKPAKETNEVLTASGESEDWYYRPKRDKWGKSILDNQGNTIYSLIFSFINKEITKVARF